MEVRIKSAHFVAQWKWDCKDDTCDICKQLFESSCPSCSAPGDDCPILIGKCSHTFHMHCIVKWCEQAGSNALCPMCRQLWEVQKT